MKNTKKQKITEEEIKKMPPRLQRLFRKVRATIKGQDLWLRHY